MTNRRATEVEVVWRGGTVGEIVRGQRREEHALKRPEPLVDFPKAISTVLDGAQAVVQAAYVGSHLSVVAPGASDLHAQGPEQHRIGEREHGGRGVRRRAPES